MVNTRHLIHIAERERCRLADMLEETAARYPAAVDASDHIAIVTAHGLVREP